MEKELGFIGEGRGLKGKECHVFGSSLLIFELSLFFGFVP